MKIIAACLIPFAFASCDKEPSVENSIVSTWKIVENYAEYKQVDPYTAVNDEPCFLDDLYIIKSNGSFSIDNGPTKCDDDDPQLFEGGVWKRNGNLLDFGVPGDIETYTILKLDQTTLEIVHETDLLKVYYRFERKV